MTILLLRDGPWDEARYLAETTAQPYALGPLARRQGDAAVAWAQVHAMFPRGPSTEPGDIHLWDAHEVQRLAADLALDEADLPAARAWIEAHDRWLAWSGAALGRAEGHLC